MPETDLTRRSPGDTYIGTTESLCFPRFTGAMLLEFLELGKTEGQTEALQALRQRFRAREAR